MRGQKGFGLIELAVVLAILSIITAGAAMTTVQTLRVTTSSHDHAIATRQTQNFGSRISPDLMMAATSTVGDDPGTGDVECITLEWKDWETGYMYEVAYTWLDSADLPKGILRKQATYNGNGVQVSGTSTLVAYGIYSANLSLEDAEFTLVVEGKLRQVNEARDYDIIRRKG